MKHRKTTISADMLLIGAMCLVLTTTFAAASWNQMGNEPENTVSSIAVDPSGETNTRSESERLTQTDTISQY